MSLTALFDIGKTGVLTYQKALEVVSHNISNAATEGYTRQDVIFQNMSSGILSLSGVTGRGVKLEDIRRMYDSFIDLQLKTESSNLAYWDVVYNGMLRLENIFNDASETAFSNSINDFFNAWQELSQNPSGTAERTLLLDKANYLTKRLNLSYKSLIDERQEIYKDTQSLVNQVNNYLDQINELNEKIAASPGSLDAKDQRDNLVKQLNDIVQITYFEDNSGRYSILLGGMPLVDGGKVYHLSTALDSKQNMQFSLETVSGSIDVTRLIQGGKLKAEIDLRDETIPEYMEKLNMLVFDLTEAINAQHRQGYGLDGTTGNNFFSQLYDLTVSSPSSPTSPYSDISFKINNVNTNTYDEYQVEFDGSAVPPAWTVTDNTTSSSITPTVTSWTKGTDTYYKLSFNDIEVTIKNPDNTLDFTFQIKQHSGLLFNVEITDTQKIAAAAANPTTTSGEMDNENARAIYSLLDSEIIGNSTPIDFYRAIVSEVGVYSSSAQTQKSFQQSLVEEIEKRRQDVSGVSLDEEAVNLIKYQKMYEASARVIKVADEILATLFDMVS
ncbi:MULTISPECIES: flagellar hook-associated protein FlgK [Thermodesulfovibrio]|uniref:Flagellar hook-associated protein 1 n=1 Tax=Thermodesulfovibrio yellowstonii (strain ATCC 51303 / DSM 11347 / YP87) TaxID=289376 RepID=B5YIW7_THEYD|nr:MULTISPECIES: flagellar hook-associated protein FlgK [Thermodesulfovibrio]ACI20958.1 flagellar hook-associated protein FlgK [Thermodesulfovibrio yellowstonii DSM 11347]MDI6864457.1 flagellar hook-associated protein FlgK [Thermodesulfovibrio yellowstonii]